VVDNPARSSLRRRSVPGRQGGVESSRSPSFDLLNLLFEVGEPLLPFATFPKFDASFQQRTSSPQAHGFAVRGEQHAQHVVGLASPNPRVTYRPCVVGGSRVGRCDLCVQVRRVQLLAAR
jgi:hypothetical protein